MLKLSRIKEMHLLGNEKRETTKIYAQLSGKLRQDYYSKYF